MGVCRIGGDVNTLNPIYSVLHADLRGLPPTLLHVASDEQLLDDTRMLYRKLLRLGVSANIQVFEGLFHVAHVFWAEYEESRKAMDQIIDFVTTGVAAEQTAATRLYISRTPSLEEYGCRNCSVEEPIGAWAPEPCPQIIDPVSFSLETDSDVEKEIEFHIEFGGGCRIPEWYLEKHGLQMNNRQDDMKQPHSWQRERSNTSPRSNRNEADQQAGRSHPDPFEIDFLYDSLPV